MTQRQYMDRLMESCFIKATNGQELTSRLCIASKFHGHRLLPYRYNTRGYNQGRVGTKSKKRVMVMIGNVYKALKSRGMFVINSYSHKRPYYDDVLLVKGLICKYLNVEYTLCMGKLTIIGRYYYVRELLLAWKKGTLVEFPRDVIKYLSKYVTYEI